MSEEKQVEKKSDSNLRPKAQGNIFLKIGIVLMTLVLIWSILGPAKEKQIQKNYHKLTKAKIKMLFQLEYLTLYTDTSFTSDIDKLIDFAKQAKPEILPDSLFQPLYNAYMRFEENHEALGGKSLGEFKKIYLDSLSYNPYTGEKFILELATKSGRKTFNIKPSKDEKDIEKIGAVIEGEISWDEKAELAL
ncbi:hypothetical protein JNL27_12455 [bacterium]|nr:hypothetical protein [bacterium]